MADNKLPIRVCIVCPKAYPLFNERVEGVFGGAEVDLYYLATELAKDKNFKVSFITADYGQADIETIEDVTVIKSLDFRKNALNGAWRIWRALSRANADIYMIKTASLGVPLTAVFCKLHGKAFVYRTAHRDECDGTYLRKHYFAGKAFAASLRQAKMVFSQSLSDKEKLSETIGVNSTVIANGHRLAKAADAKRDSILWVGRTADFKRPEKFIELARKFPGEKFVMICQKATGDDNYDRLCREAGSVSNIQFHQRVAFSEIDIFFPRAKIVVNTSDAEGFPNVFIQACKAGAAILSLNVNPDSFLDKYGCGISCAGDENRMTQSLKSMLEENSFLEFGQNGRKYAEEHHDIAKIAGEYKKRFCGLAVG